jgi:hypothetical protein
LLDAITLPPPLPGAADAALADPAPEGSAVPAGGAAIQDPSLTEPTAGLDEGSAEPAGSAAAAPSATATPRGKPGSSVYLSDKELLKMQSATDEGEVSE